MLAALLLPFASQAQETVTIGEGTSTTYVTPFNSLWGYSFVEQIYLASEIGTDGNITAVRFYLSSGTQTNNITLYMKNVTRSTFSSTSDYESVSASDIVYTGSLTFTAGWVEIQLDQPFEYDGSSNLLVAMHEYTSGYSTLYFNYTEAADRVLTFHSDSANPDPYNLGSYSGNKYTSPNRANIQLDIEPVGEVSCYAVKNLHTTDISGHSVTLIWSDTTNSGATYDIYQIAPSADNDTTFDTILLDNTSDFTYTISGLAPETSFRFGVAANCGADGPSNTRFVDATTAVACPAPTGLTAIPVEGDSTAVTINWDPIDGTAWQLCINGDTSSLIDVTDLPYLLENLTPETSYTVKVRRDCSDDNDGFSAWSSTVTFEPTAKTVIGSFQTTSSNLPTNCYYKYALTQQLYTAAELGEAGTIMSVDFMCQGNQTRNIDIYMVSTANNTLTSFIPVSAADLVFSGSVNFTSNNWTSIQLTTPFIYGGTGNVVIVIDDNTGSYESTTYFKTFNASNQAIYVRSDGTNYNALAPSSYSSSTESSKNCIRILKGELPDCMPATMLTVLGNTVNAHEATLTWEGESDSYLVEYKEASDSVWIEVTTTDDSITLTNLDPVTTYNVRVTAICGGESSLTSGVVSFTTTVACFPPSNVRAELTSLYSTVNVAWTDTLAGSWELRYWTGNDTSDIIELTDTTYTLEDLDENTTYRYQVRANCDDEGYSVWAPANGRSFTTPLACEVPTELSAVLTPGNGTVATINWVDTVASAWQLCFNGDTNNIIDVTETTLDFDTLTPETTYTIKVRANCGDHVSPWSNTISFTPTNSYTYTVADGTNTNSYVPVYGFYADAYQRIQTVYPAASIATLAGSDITGLTYYLSSPASEAWTGTFTVKMMEVTDATLSAFNTATDNEPVLYTGTLDATGTTMTITLSQPYTYAGGNLLIEVNETVTGNYKSSSFYGVSATGASQQGYDYDSWTGITGSAQNFIPKTTFSFEPGVITDCTRPDSLTVSDVDAHSATFDWQGEASEYLLQYKQADATDWTEVSNVSAPYTLTGLQQNTAYSARVKAICGSDTSMASFAVSFTTTISCPAPTNIQAILTPGDGTVARVTWTDTVGTAWQVCLVLDGDTSNIYDVTDTTAYDFTELTPEAIYTVMVRTICDEASDDISEWVHGTFNPTAKVVVGTPQTTNYYLPTESNYNYSLTQQIYTAAELGNTPGAIMSVDFMNGGTEKTRNIDVYMISTTASTISSFVPVTASDLVFSGTVTFTPNTWTSLVFDNPFIYDGTSNVLLVVDDNNGSYSYGLACYTFTAANQAIYVYSDGTNYNPFAPSSYSGTVSSVKNYVRFLLGEPPTCLPVGDLTIDDSLTTANSITLTWSDTNAVNNYNIYIINGDNDSLIGTTTEMTYTITDLEATTGYTFGVAVNCGDEVSTMRTVSGRTDCAGGSCNITIQGHDTYSGADGWNGATISVIQAGETVGTFTVPSGNQHLTGTIQVCSGAPVSLSWTSGSYDSEAYFEILDGGGLEVYSVASGSGASIPDGVFFTIADPCPSCLPVADFEVSEIGNHSAMLSWTEQGEATSWQVMIDGDTTNAITVNDTEYELTGLSSDSSYTVTVRAICDDEDMSAWAAGITFNTLIACPTPTDLMADVLPTSAELTWNGFADAYQLEYAIIPENTEDTNASNEGIWLQYDNGNNSNNIGNANGGTFTWGTMYPASMLAGNSNLTKVAVYENSSYLTSPYTVNVYTGGTTAPGTLVATETVTPMGTNGIHEVNLSTIANINPSDNLWVTVTATGTYIIAACTVTPVDPNNQWIEDGGTWANIGDLASTLANYSWMIRAYVEPGFNEDEMTWTVVNNVTSPYTLNNLTPESHYAVRVKAVCGTDGESDYAYTTFFTPSACADVENVTVSDITSVSANLSWHGYQNSYDVRYRVPAHLTPIMVEGFESGIPATWTTIDGDNDSNNWFALSDLATIYPYYADEDESSLAWQHSGENAACSPSYANGVGDFNSSHWLITPQLNLQGVMKCYVGSVLSSYPDSYEVLLSTTGIDTSNFTITLKPMATAAAINNGWDEVSIDLSAYEGQQGYIAIHHVSSDMYFLVVDDFGIYGDTIDAGPWTEMTVSTASAALTGLNPETTYEYQVRGICGAGQYTDWSEAATFTTEAASCIVYGDTTTATACDSYTWNGQVYTQSGTYTQTLTTAANCDSILTLILTINNSVAVTVTESAETSYTWNGQTYTESGVYTWTGTTVAGCDSTVTLVLTIGGTQPTTYTVTVHYDATMGNVTGIPTGPVAAGTQVTLTANPLTGYHFMNWSTGDTTRTITLTVNSDIDITANFEANQIEETYTVTVNYDATMGTVTGIPMAPVTAGTEVTLTATALPGFAFVNWSTGDTTATITITVTANIEITANFRSLDGIEDADMNNVSIFSANSTIYVKGAEGQNIYIYDLNGRTIATKLNATETMEIPMEQTGVYLVRVGNASAKRVIVMR